MWMPIPIQHNPIVKVASFLFFCPAPFRKNCPHRTLKEPPAAPPSPRLLPSRSGWSTPMPPPSEPSCISDCLKFWCQSHFRILPILLPSNHEAVAHLTGSFQKLRAVRIPLCLLTRFKFPWSPKKNNRMTCVRAF